jgi:hypothetical protein
MPMLLGYEGIRGAVRLAVEQAGFTMHRLEELLPDADWQLWVARAAQTADLVVADVTDNNPFVMYELATAHAHRTPTLLIVNRRNQAVPATVKGSFFLSYDDDELGAFGPRLTRAILRVSSLRWRGEPAMPVDGMYAAARGWLHCLKERTAEPLESVSSEEFATFIDVALRRGELPALDGDAREAAEILLARAVSGSDNCDVMDVIEAHAPTCRETA